MNYNKNFEFNTNRHNLLTINDYIEAIENKLHHRYGHMKTQVHRTYDEYDPSVHKCDGEGYDEIMKYS